MDMDEGALLPHEGVGVGVPLEDGELPLPRIAPDGPRTPPAHRVHIREACEADAPAITAIHNDAVEHSTAVWDETPVDVADRLAWMAAHRELGNPVLVAVGSADAPEAAGPEGAEGTVLGYAAFGPWRAWEGYRHTVEHSVYVRSDRRGSGLGRALLLALIAAARVRGVHVMVAGIESGNAASIHLHETLGFRPVGHLAEVGAKFGRWLDLDFLQLVLDTRATPER